MSNRIVVSASSDIGAALVQRWLSNGHRVWGTYRTRSAAIDSHEQAGAICVPCDLEDPASVEAAAAVLRQQCKGWEALVLAPGALEPIGPFLQCDFEAWQRSVQVNFIAQMRIVRALLANRGHSATHGPIVLVQTGSRPGATMSFKSLVAVAESFLRLLFEVHVANRANYSKHPRRIFVSFLDTAERPAATNVTVTVGA